MDVDVEAPAVPVDVEVEVEEEAPAPCGAAEPPLHAATRERAARRPMARERMGRDSTADGAPG